MITLINMSSKALIMGFFVLIGTLVLIPLAPIISDLTLARNVHLIFRSYFLWLIIPGLAVLFIISHYAGEWAYKFKKPGQKIKHSGEVEDEIRN